MTIKACVFDAYGTLFDVAAAAREAARDPAFAPLRDLWPQVARDWRLKQLQYTWLRAVADAHCDFWQVTQDGLDWALDSANLADPALRERLLALYWELSPFPEVPQVLATLKARGFQTAILSNGSPAMLDGAVQSAGLGDVLDDVLSVQSVGVFKPHASVYQLAVDRFDCPPDQILFVSSNGWDAAGGAGFGFRTVWVNRMAEPIDRLPWRPTEILTDLTEIPDLAGRF
ncbi:haloacid dehalogenase type II [Aliiroseovarius sp. PTFE2010]|uniref:haloacid dehalogenase type II n=1 Tax=Aliiroseovarius sp. PTFE2010 TaxID=3417190 RepID=UPI003CE77E91